MKAEERDTLLKELVTIAKENDCTSFAMIITIAEMSHSRFFKNRFNKEKKIISIIEANKKEAEKDILKNIVRSIHEFRIYNATEIASFNRLQYNTYKEKYAAHPDVKAAIAEAKRSTKYEIRNKLLENKSPAALLGLYKLLGTKEEVDRLNGSTKSIDLTSGGKPIIQPMIIQMAEDEEE